MSYNKLLSCDVYAPRSFHHEAWLHDEKSPTTFPLTLCTTVNKDIPIYYLFSHQKGRYKNGWGMGRAVEMELEQTRENIVINHGECLNKRSADSKIKQIIKLFGID